MKTKKQITSGFTIIELLVVIVIIGILAAITTVSYNAVQVKVRDNSVLADVESIFSKELNYTMDNASGKAYDSTSGYDGDLKFTPNSGNVIDVAVSGTDFCVRGYNTRGTLNSIDNSYKKESSPGACDRVLNVPDPITCLAGFIPVPGSATYGTDDFCVMKYEAKADINGDGVGDTDFSTSYGTWPANTQTISATRKLVSTPQGYPVGYITRAQAIQAAAEFTAGCDTGCHLITENEWMTIAQNVLSVSSNWSTGTVGSGSINRGHTDSNPPNALQADTNLVDGEDCLTGTLNSGPSVQCRILTLTNGQVIWDMSGNILEFTNATVGPNQHPGVSTILTNSSIEWNQTSFERRGLPYNSTPQSTAVSGINWGADYSIGQKYSSYGLGIIFTDYDSVIESTYSRGGWHNSGINYAGITALAVVGGLTYTDEVMGLRVVQDL